ncbi:YraN family protein [Candidatus Microgenomates bacterium]|nr:YraN family protein [Candidatus Microgenomates bacterium]
MVDKISRGQEGEKIAASYLKSQGYQIIEKNFKKRYGEIDLIALEKNILVFIEVKTRWSKKFGPPEEAVTPRKLRSVIKTAQYYKMIHPELPEAMRIDVVAVDFTAQGREERIRLIKNVTG